MSGSCAKWAGSRSGRPDLGGRFSLLAIWTLKPGLRARQEIRCAFWRERRAGRCKAPRRWRCGGIVEERQRRRCPPAAAPLRAAARRPAGCGQRSENGRGLPHSRDGHATRLAWHERLARQRPGGVEDSLGITSRPYEEGASQVSGRKCDYRTDQDIPGPGYMKVEALIEVPDAQHRG